MRVIANISAEDIVEQLDREEAMKLIIDLDRGQADYDFTLRLAKHLVKELKESAPLQEPFQLSELEQ